MGGRGWREGPARTAIMKPHTHQITAPTLASSRFLSRMFFVFLARTVPASRRAKPHCMKKTKKPQTMSQKASACAAPK